MIHSNNVLRNKKSEDVKFESILRVSKFTVGTRNYTVTLHRTGIVDLHEGDGLVARVHAILWRKPDKGYLAKFTGKLGSSTRCFLPRLDEGVFHAFWLAFVEQVNGLPEYLLKKLYVHCRGERVYLGENVDIVLVWHPDHEMV